MNKDHNEKGGRGEERKEGKKAPTQIPKNQRNVLNIPEIVPQNSDEVEFNRIPFNKWHWMSMVGECQPKPHTLYKNSFKMDHELKSKAIKLKKNFRRPKIVCSPSYVDIRSRTNTTMGLDYEHMIEVRAHKGGVRIGRTSKKLASICCP
jgi:hypothetical protein